MDKTSLTLSKELSKDCGYFRPEMYDNWKKDRNGANEPSLAKAVFRQFRGRDENKANRGSPGEFDGNRLMDCLCRTAFNSVARGGKAKAP